MTDPIHQLAAILRDTANALAELEPAVRRWYAAQAWPPRRGEPVPGVVSHDISDPTGQQATLLATEAERDVSDAQEARRLLQGILSRRQTKVRLPRQASTCTHDGCDQPVHGHGECQRHYRQTTRQR